MSYRSYRSYRSWSGNIICRWSALQGLKRETLPGFIRGCEGGHRTTGHEHMRLATKCCDLRGSKKWVTKASKPQRDQDSTNSTSLTLLMTSGAFVTIQRQLAQHIKCRSQELATFFFQILACSVLSGRRHTTRSFQLVAKLDVWCDSPITQTRHGYRVIRTNYVWRVSIPLPLIIMNFLKPKFNQNVSYT